MELSRRDFFTTTGAVTLTGGALYVFDLTRSDTHSFLREGVTGKEDIPSSDTELKYADTGPAGPYQVLAPERIPYGPDPRQYGLLYLPSAGQKPFPIIVMMHGGGWRLHTTLKYFNPLSRDLATLGAAVWNIEYGGVSPDHKNGWPRIGLDIARSVDFLEQLSIRFPGQLDLRNVFFVGHSSGAQLAAWAASRYKFPPRFPGSIPNPKIRIRGLITISGVFDLVRAYESGRDIFLHGLFDASPREKLLQYQQASPMNYLPLQFPTVCVHGTNDQIVSVDQSINYVIAARKRGGQSMLVLLPDEGHVDMVAKNSQGWSTIRGLVEQMVVQKQRKPGR